MKKQDGTPLPDDTLLSEVVLSSHAEKVARYAEPPIKTVGDLRRRTDAELLQIEGCGKMALLEFRLLTGQHQSGKATISDRVMKRDWVRAIRFGTFDGSFEDWRKEANQ